jgi:outer membrane protein, multidrug efflux system
MSFMMTSSSPSATLTVASTSSLPPFRRVAVVLAAVLMLAGCATKVDNTQPALALPATWSEGVPTAATARLEREWWRSFRSEELVRLVDEAQAGSTDLMIAAERVKQAELAARLAGASLFPQVDVGADTGERFTATPGSGNTQTTRFTSAAISASYEIDLWGRVAATVRGSEATLLGSRYDLETARLSLTTGVANAYFQVISLRMRLVVARENLAIAERVQGIVEARYRNGVATALDASRQRTAVLTQRTAGLPSSLLNRRPDLASVEAQLAGADADVAAARAALFPTISLSATAGMSSTALLTLSNPIFSAEIAASIMRTIFGADRLRSQIQTSESTRRQLVLSYKRSVYTALKEVDDALGNATRNHEQERNQVVIRDEARRALSLSELRFKEGADDLNSLLDAQRTLFAADEALALQRLNRLSGSIAVFKALGGGWERPDPSKTPATEFAR